MSYINIQGSIKYIQEDIDFEYESENDVLEFEEEESQSRPRETPPSEGISVCYYLFWKNVKKVFSR